MSEAPPRNDEPDSTPSEHQPNGRLLETAVLGGVVLALTGLVTWWGWFAPRDSDSRRSDRASEPVVSRSDPSDPYIGSQACAECHPGIAAYQVQSGHAKTLRRAEERLLARWLDGRTFPDPEAIDLAWRYELNEDGLFIERLESGRASGGPLDFAFGSTQHATTFVSVTDPEAGPIEGVEHRMTYYPDLDAMALTPGHSAPMVPPGFTMSPFGRPLDHDTVLECFGCHTVRTSRQGAGHLDFESMIPNVGCEACHGPGRAHVEAARLQGPPEDLAMPFGTGSAAAAPEAVNTLCAECHRPNTTLPDRIVPGNRNIIRFQSIGMAQSACFKSGVGMTCLTCHDPHRELETDRAAYEPICLSCHDGQHSPQGSQPIALEPAQETLCPTSPTNGCLDCHMPRLELVAGLAFSDHWIRVFEPEELEREPLDPGVNRDTVRALFEAEAARATNERPSDR